MEFALNEEQSLLQASVRRFVEKSYAFEVQRETAQRHAGFSRDQWKTFAEMGWLGVALSEDVGGYGGSAVEQAIVLEELGRGLVLEPYLAAAVLTAQLIDRCTARRTLLPPLVSGENIVLLGHGEPGARGRVAWVETRATRTTSGGWTLRGRKSLVVGGPVADRFIVSARTAGGAGDESGITLFLLDADAPGLGRRDYRLIDDRPACDLVLDGVEIGPASMLGGEGNAYPRSTTRIAARLPACAPKRSERWNARSGSRATI
jgi:alkylation response protein AidB-like acyl-CoA dehydrogenase